MDNKTQTVKLIRKARPGFPAKYCTGAGHYLLYGNGQWSVCDSYLKIDHNQCEEQSTQFQGFISKPASQLREDKGGEK